MAFSQLHYTSCENGLANYAGFQFCAMTPGIPAEVMREVERLTVYELPFPGIDDNDPAAREFPVNLLYTFSDKLGVAIVAQVKFAGRDFSNRPGNYFAHSLVTARPERDLQSVLPAEFWAAPFWVSTQQDMHELRPLSAPPGRGPLTRHIIDEFLTAEPSRNACLEKMLIAADRALRADRRVLLIGANSTIVCYWIAAVSYLLGPVLGPRLTFSTYTHDPRRCLTHVVGTVPVERGDLADPDTYNFYVFNLTDGTFPDVPHCPAAALLARQSVAMSADLWNLAMTLGDGRGASLGDSFSLLAVALLLLGHQLTPDELGSAIEWFSAASSEAADQIEPAINSALKQAVDVITVRQQEQLVDLALRVEHGEYGALADQVECVIVRRTLSRIDKGETYGGSLLLREHARTVASVACTQRLPGDSVSKVLTLLLWAHEVGAEPDEDALKRTGHDLLFPELLDDPASAELAAVAEAWPALRAGLVDNLASQPVAVQQQVFARSPGAIFHADDFVGRPGLGEHWVISAARRGQVTRSAALVEVTRFRRSDGGPAIIDELLLLRIWQNGNWTATEAAEVLSGLETDELASEPVRGQLAGVLKGVPGVNNGLRAWMDFVTLLAPLGQAILNQEDAALATALTSAIQSIRIVVLGREPAAATAVDDLFTHYPDGSPSLRTLLELCLPPLLLRRPNLSAVLRDCPIDLFIQFCEYARESLANGSLETRAVAELFISMLQLEERRKRYARLLEARVFLPVLPRWSRREIARLGTQMDEIRQNSSSDLDRWYRRYSKSKGLPWHGH